MPPEYVLYGQVSVKSDVYSFGVLILEIVSGQRISSFIHEEDSEDLLSFVSLDNLFFPSYPKQWCQKLDKAEVT